MDGCWSSTTVPCQWWLSEWVTPGDTAILGMISLKDWDLQHLSALTQSPKRDVELNHPSEINPQCNLTEWYKSCNSNKWWTTLQQTGCEFRSCWTFVEHSFQGRHLRGLGDRRPPPPRKKKKRKKKKKKKEKRGKKKKKKERKKGTTCSTISSHFFIPLTSKSRLFYLLEKCFVILQVPYVWDSDIEKPWFGGQWYEDVTWKSWTCNPYSLIIPNEQYLYKRNVPLFYKFLIFELVTLKSLGLKVTGMRTWLDIVEHVVPIVISYEIKGIYKREVSEFYNFLMFEVVTSKSLALEVTGMKKWLDNVGHVVPIVISYKMNSIYKRNVS